MGESECMTRLHVFVTEQYRHQLVPLFRSSVALIAPKTRRLRATVELLKSLHRTLHAAVSAQALAMVKKFNVARRRQCASTASVKLAKKKLGVADPLLVRERFQRSSAEQDEKTS